MVTVPILNRLPRDCADYHALSNRVSHGEPGSGSGLVRL